MRSRCEWERLLVMCVMLLSPGACAVHKPPADAKAVAVSFVRALRDHDLRAIDSLCTPSLASTLERNWPDTNDANLWPKEILRPKQTEAVRINAVSSDQIDALVVADSAPDGIVSGVLVMMLRSQPPRVRAFRFEPDISH